MLLFCVNKRIIKFVAQNHPMRSLSFLLCLILSLGFSTKSYLQSGYSIKGEVKSTESESIEFGNVLVLNGKDSTLLKGSLFESGKFNIHGINTNNVLIKIVSTGYVDLFKTVNNASGKDIDLGVLRLENQTLDEVEITARAPVFINEGDKIIVNVENSMLGSSGTALDVLKKSPKVIVDNNDNVSVFGKGNAIIYLDGQQINTTDLLKSLSSNEIKEIEVISNPSAKYDAGGAAVINIKTKAHLEGHQVNIYNYLIQGKNFRVANGFQANIKKKKWGLFGSYWINNGKRWTSDEYNRTIEEPDTIIKMDNLIENTRTMKNQHYYKIGGTFNPDSLSQIGLQYNGFYWGHDINSQNKNVISNKDEQLYALNTSTVGALKTLFHSVNLNYKRDLDTNGRNFFSAIQLSQYGSTQNDFITQKIDDIDDADIRNIGKSDINIINAKFDYTHPFKKKWTFETGAKYSQIFNNSDILFEKLGQNDIWLSDPRLNNSYKYDEKIAATYAEITKKWKKAKFRTGVRAEYAQTIGFSNVLNEEIINRDFFGLFPNVFFSYNFTKDLTATINYRSRIKRPTYQDLNPFVDYIDSLSAMVGNPFLKPSYTHSAEASLIYMEYASIEFGYSRTQNDMQLFVERINDGSNSFIATTKNIDFAEKYTLGLVIPYELDWWTTYNGFGMEYNNFTYEDQGNIINNTKPLYYVYLYNELRIPKWFSMEVTYEYYTAGVDGIFSFEPIQQLSASLKKTFLKDKLIVRLMADDILGTYVETGVSNLSGFDVRYKSLYETKMYRIGLQWKFGKLKSTYKDKSVNGEEYNRIKMD